MTNLNSLDAYYAAFERLKQGQPRLDKFFGITSDKITVSSVSQEAGFDSGYLKKKRPNHQGIISLIEAYRNHNTPTNLSKAEITKREKHKTAKYKERLEMIETLLEQSLARELLLVTKLAEMEKSLQLLD